MIASVKLMINCSEVTTWFGYHAASCSYIVTSEPLQGIAVLIKLRGGWISWCVRLEISLLRNVHAYAASSATIKSINE